jgi:hypothetical protein
MPESLKTKIIRWGFNFFPAYRGTGAWITYISLVTGAKCASNSR